MYNNIGGKLKGLAIVIFILEALVTIIFSFVIMASGNELGILLFFVGPIIAWASSLLIYGFGELICKITDIEVNTRGDNIKSKTQHNIDEERVDKLERLRAQNLISEEEYQQAIMK